LGGFASTGGLRSKSWDEFAVGVPVMDFVFGLRSDRRRNLPDLAIHHRALGRPQSRRRRERKIGAGGFSPGLPAAEARIKLFVQSVDKLDRMASVASMRSVGAVGRCDEAKSSPRIGTALLLAAVVGSGIMAERLSGRNNGIARERDRDRRGALPAHFELRRLIGAHSIPPRSRSSWGSTASCGGDWSDPMRLCRPSAR
jgi:hypothetical protein